MPSAFGAYRVLHQTGSGVLGPVFRAFDPQGDRLVVIKAFKLDLLPEQTVRLADALRRMVTRAQPHPALVGLVDAGLEGTTPFLAMAHAPGETLDVLLRRASPLGLDRAIPILADVAAALDASWADGHGHGALHPRDIFVTVDGPNTPSEVTLTGVGLVGAFENAGISSTPRRPYAAPERAAGHDWDVRADVYSLGVIAHEMLTGRRPLSAGEQDGAFDTAASPEARVALRRVLARALDEHPHGRFDSAASFIDALLAVAHGDFAILQSTSTEPTAVEPREDVPDALPLVTAPLVSSAPVAPVALPTSAHDVPESVEPPAAIVATDIPVVPPPPPAPRPAGPPIEPAVALLRPEPDVDEHHVAAGLVVPPPAARAPYPWAAMAMVLLAGVSIGVVGGYQWRGRHTPTPVAPPLVVDAAAPADTEVKVAPPAEPPDEVGTAPVTEAPAVAVPDARRAVASTGRLMIRSTPAGATVTIDGQPLGETPVSLADVSFGTHAVRVAHAGYAPFVRQVTLSAATPMKSLTARLERGPGVGAGRGAIEVDSRPRGARVIVDGRPVGTTPMRVAQLGVGSHTVTVEKAGHKPVTTKTTVEAGKSATVRVTLEPQRPGAKSSGTER